MGYYGIYVHVIFLDRCSCKPFLNSQGAKTSVKAKIFVSTLRDHLMNEGSVPGTPQAEKMITGSSSGSFLINEPSTLTSSDIRTRPTYREVDEKDIWVFDFINVAHVQPIVEAMDDDCSGFISVKEANMFALSRPKGWRSVVPYDYEIHSFDVLSLICNSLLQWIAYWAAG